MTTLYLKLGGRKIILKFEARHSSEAKFYRVMHIYKNRDFSCTFIFFSDSGRYLCVNAYFGASIHLILFMVNKKHGKQKIEKSGIYKRYFLYAQWKIIDGVKYVHCIKHAYKYLLREQVGFAAVLWRFRQCVSRLQFILNIYEGKQRDERTIIVLNRNWLSSKISGLFLASLKTWLLLSTRLGKCMRKTVEGEHVFWQLVH